MAKKWFWGIRSWQIFTILAIYLVFAIQYWLALYLTSNGITNAWREAIIDYSLKLLLTAPVWWLVFVKCKDRSLRFRLSIHLFAMPVWLIIWFNGYRWIQDLRGGGYLTGTGVWWDIYIPGLIYCLQFAVFHVYEYYTETQKQKQKEKELMQAAHNSEVNALKAQIQPHFLFNTLNSISASVPGEMEHTRELIAKLADTFRYSLNASERERITLREELEFIRITLDLEKERLKQRLQVEFDVDDSALNASIPPMLLQPITENAIKHGIAPQIEGGKVTVKVKRTEDRINIEISDTGVGYDGKLDGAIFRKGIGLRNINQIVEKLYNEPISVRPNHPSGLIFSLNIDAA